MRCVIYESIFLCTTIPGPIYSFTVVCLSTRWAPVLLPALCLGVVPRIAARNGTWIPNEKTLWFWSSHFLYAYQGIWLRAPKEYEKWWREVETRSGLVLETLFAWISTLRNFVNQIAILKTNTKQKKNIKSMSKKEKLRQSKNSTMCPENLMFFSYCCVCIFVQSAYTCTLSVI